MLKINVFANVSVNKKLVVIFLPLGPPPCGAPLGALPLIADKFWYREKLALSNVLIRGLLLRVVSPNPGTVHISDFHCRLYAKP